METALPGWTDFNLALAGAGAALGGLLIVAISVNIKQITASPRLAARASAAISTLILGVVSVSVALIPGQPLWLVGLEVLLATVPATVIASQTAGVVVRETQSQYRRRDALNLTLIAVPILGFAVGGVLMLFSVAGGFYLIAFATLIAIVGAVLFSWVALVEILR